MPTPARLLPLLLLSAMLAAGLSACSDEPLPPPLEVYEDGRAVVVDTATGGVLLIEHEPFDSVMTEPMVMRLPLEDPRAAGDLMPGDKIQFELVMRQDYRLRNVEKLPPGTRLSLTADSTVTDTTAASGPTDS